jgi:uncharacterized protein (TIGR02270 family)
LHLRDPGEPLRKALESSDAEMQATALRVAGELGIANLGPLVRWHLSDEDPACRFWAAATLCLFGSDPEALGVLIAESESAGAFSEQACRLAARRLGTGQAERWIQSLAASPDSTRLAICATEARGAPELVPWLLDQMEAAPTARVAGEAFACITGTDLKHEGLWTEQPEGFTIGPTHDPEDDGVDMDPDEHLVWPKVTDVRAFWSRNAGRFVQGVRYILGAPIAPAHCEGILRDGRQPHRAAAATELVLMSPSPLFATTAPALRQLSILRAADATR